MPVTHLNSDLSIYPDQQRSAIISTRTLKQHPELNNGLSSKYFTIEDKDNSQFKKSYRQIKDFVAHEILEIPIVENMFDSKEGLISESKVSL